MDGNVTAQTEASADSVREECGGGKLQYCHPVSAGSYQSFLRYRPEARPAWPQVIERVRQKAAMYGCDPAPALEDGIHPEADGEVWPACASYKVNPNLVAELYERWVMPLTKEVQVAYLLRRLDGVP